MNYNNQSINDFDNYVLVTSPLKNDEEIYNPKEQLEELRQEKELIQNYLTLKMV